MRGMWMSSSFPAWSEKSRECLCVWMNPESKRRRSSYFRLYTPLCTCYAVGFFFFFFFCQFRVVFFLNYSGIVTNQMYSVSLLLAISDFHTWISGNGENTEPMKFWTCFNILKMHCHSHILLKEKKKVFCPACPRSRWDTWCCCWTPNGREMLLPVSPRSHQQLPPASIDFFFSISVLQTVQTLVEYS